MKTSGVRIVDEMMKFNATGNVIPAQWYKTITKENGKIETGYRKKGDSVEIYVKDNGIGIDKKYHGKIFAKFVQLNNIYSKKESSTGLGLTITKELTELHGGTITFESTVDVGSTFYVMLPVETVVREE